MSRILLLSQRDRTTLRRTGILEIVRDVVPQPHLETTDLGHADGVVVCDGRVWRIGKAHREIRPRFGEVGESLLVVEPFRIQYEQKLILFEDGTRTPIQDLEWMEKMRARGESEFAPVLLPAWACRGRVRLLSCSLQKQSATWKWVGYAQLE